MILIVKVFNFAFRKTSIQWRRQVSAEKVQHGDDKVDFNHSFVKLSCFIDAKYQYLQMINGLNNNIFEIILGRTLKFIHSFGLRVSLLKVKIKSETRFLKRFFLEIKFTKSFMTELFKNTRLNFLIENDRSPSQSD